MKRSACLGGSFCDFCSKITVMEDEIASYLFFCSQSYFGNIFCQQTGMIPAKYRKKYGKWEKRNS